MIYISLQAHVLLHFIHSSNDRQSLAQKQQKYGESDYMITTANLEAHIAESCMMVATAFGLFKSKAVEQVSANYTSLFCS